MDDSKIFSVDDENGSIFNGAIFYGTENYENFFITGFCFLNIKISK